MKSVQTTSKTNRPDYTLFCDEPNIRATGSGIQVTGKGSKHLNVAAFGTSQRTTGSAVNSVAKTMLMAFWSAAITLTSANQLSPSMVRSAGGAPSHPVPCHARFPGCICWYGLHVLATRAIRASRSTRPCNLSTPNHHHDAIRTSALRAGRADPSLTRPEPYRK